MTATQVQELTADQLEALLNEKRAQENEKKEQERMSYESLKSETIEGLAITASSLSAMLKEFKQKAFDEADTLYKLLCGYSKRHADGKGNFSVENTEGNVRMSFTRKQLGRFDERSVQAEKHIKDFITNRFIGDSDARDMIMGIMERKRGYLDINQIQRLYAMENRFEDTNWKEGIKLLKESWKPTESRTYIRFEIKVDSEWQLINLDFASI